MTWRTTVVWSEGLLLQPLHLQRRERHGNHARHLRELREFASPEGP